MRRVRARGVDDQVAQLLLEPAQNGSSSRAGARRPSLLTSRTMSSGCFGLAVGRGQAAPRHPAHGPQDVLEHLRLEPAAAGVATAVDLEAAVGLQHHGVVEAGDAAGAGHRQGEGGGGRPGRRRGGGGSCCSRFPGRVRRGRRGRPSPTRRPRGRARRCPSRGSALPVRSPWCPRPPPPARPGCPPVLRSDAGGGAPVPPPVRLVALVRAPRTRVRRAPGAGLGSAAGFPFHDPSMTRMNSWTFSSTKRATCSRRTGCRCWPAPSPRPRTRPVRRRRRSAPAAAV